MALHRAGQTISGTGSSKAFNARLRDEFLIEMGCALNLHQPRPSMLDQAGCWRNDYNHFRLHSVKLREPGKPRTSSWLDQSANRIGGALEIALNTVDRSSPQHAGNPGILNGHQFASAQGGSTRQLVIVAGRFGRRHRAWRPRKLVRARQFPFPGTDSMRGIVRDIKVLNSGFDQ